MESYFKGNIYQDHLKTKWSVSRLDKDKLKFQNQRSHHILKNHVVPSFLLFSGSLSLCLAPSASHEHPTNPDWSWPFFSVCHDALAQSLCCTLQISLWENHIGLSNLPAVPPEFKWLNPYPVQLILARSRGLVTSEMAVGGQTSK